MVVLVCAYCSACADLCDNGPESLALPGYRVSKVVVLVVVIV